MRLCFIFVLAIFCCCDTSAQFSNYEIDGKILSIPESQSASTAGIASYISSHFKDQTDKARAAYTWVVNNIKYDTDSMYAINWNKGGNLKVTESLRRRRGVCENFASIFADILIRTGMTAMTIDGYTKQGGFVNRTGHTWSAVLVDEQWYLFDPTWDKDRRNEYLYYKVDPSVLAASHMPFDPIWQLTDSPISHREFQGRGTGKSGHFTNHTDSIKAFMRMGELEKLEATSRRMNSSDKISDLLKNRIAFLHMQIVTAYEEIDMLLYNAAVSDLNKATDAYNKYIGNIPELISNHTAIPEYKLSLVPALASLQSALAHIANIGKIIPNYQYDPASLKIRILQISEKIRLVNPSKDTLSKN